MSYTKDDVLAALGKVNDPDLKKDLVTLKMIEDLEVSNNKISFKVVLTTPACPLKAEIEQSCIQSIKDNVSPDAEVTIEMTSSVTSKRENDGPLLPGVRNIIAVASGKGGVGKSTVSVNMALALSKQGASVGIIDADIYGPSIPMMFGLAGARPTIKKINDKNTLIPLEKYGVKLLSIGFLIDEKQAVVWRGPMVSKALQQFVRDCEWGELDYMIIDLPPGTGDIHLTLVQTVPVTGAVIVTTPQAIALADVKKAFGMFSIQNISVPIIGVVENMSYFSPEELPDKKYHIFGEGGGQKIADEYNTTLLGQIPIVQSIREGGDSGEPAMLQPDSVTAKAFMNMAQNTAQQIAIRNAQQAPTKKVEITRR